MMEQRVVQLGLAHLADTQEVGGSNPPTLIWPPLPRRGAPRERASRVALVAQAAEREPSKLEVAGSGPARRFREPQMNADRHR
jgi:hypothetical protein